VSEAMACPYHADLGPGELLAEALDPELGGGVGTDGVG
jgi:hypothetical protein